MQDLLTDAIKTGLGPIGSSIVSIVNASTSATSNSVKYEWKQEDIRATGEERTFTIGVRGWQHQDDPAGEKVEGVPDCWEGWLLEHTLPDLEELRL